MNNVRTTRYWTILMFLAPVLALTAALSASRADAQSAAPSSRAVSLYDSESRWLTATGEQTGIGVHKGSLTLVTMIYSGCAHACPMIISKMQKIERALEKAGVTGLKFVLASFDVQRDRPEALSKYRATRRLDPERWSFLAAVAEEDARELAVALGISYKDIGGGDFSHSNTVILVDEQGVEIARIESMTASEDVFISALAKSGRKLNPQTPGAP